jgi:energy-coupling factor transporter transmembrane protein EcfT
MDFGIIYIVLIFLVVLIGFLIFKKIFGILFKILVVLLLAVIILGVIVFFDMRQTYASYTNGNTAVLVSSQNGTLISAYRLSDKEDLNLSFFNETFSEYTVNKSATPPEPYTALIILTDSEKLNFFSVVLPNDIYVYPKPKSYTWLKKIR